ncbi:MAG TPA: hypothetical protein VNI78_00415 [Vicinamibacterales bacterium]|nr:hypothetical protein [Vicinamibacterales bacterium]
METERSAEPSHCGYCGRPITDDVVSDRFGERFCSETHADEFATGVRAARIDAAARRVDVGDRRTTACPVLPAGQQGWRFRLKRAACWGAPLLLLLAIPLFWAGGWAAAGGSLLSVLALLACPLGMYFMMRTISGMQHSSDGRAQTAGTKAGNGEPRV